MELTLIEKGIIDGEYLQKMKADVIETLAPEPQQIVDMDRFLEEQQQMLKEKVAKQCSRCDERTGLVGTVPGPTYRAVPNDRNGSLGRAACPTSCSKPRVRNGSLSTAPGPACFTERIDRNGIFGATQTPACCCSTMNGNVICYCPKVGGNCELRGDLPILSRVLFR